jgi:two-component system, OmpR family, response regulator
MIVLAGRKTKPTPVLILTARDAVQDRVAGLDTGADDYLMKPFQLQELKTRLRALVRRSAGQASPVIELGSISVDTAGKQVLMDGRVVELTAVEYGLVELLALHRGKVVSRSMIYEHLFDENHDSLSNMVDVYISRLRSRLARILHTGNFA